MPVLSVFFGIVIKVFHDDHNPAHVHVEYDEHHAIMEIGSDEHATWDQTQTGVDSGSDQPKLLK